MDTPRTDTLGDGGVRRPGRERDGGVSGQLGVRADRGRTRPRREPGIRDHAAVWVIGLRRDGGPARIAARAIHLYEERGALITTAVVVHGAAEGRPSRAPVTFVL